MTSIAPGDAATRLDHLLAYLEADEGNLALLEEAADVAIAAARHDRAAELLARYAALAPLPPRLRNLAGVIALAQARFTDAAQAFGALRGDGFDDAPLRFNHAWALAMAGRYAEASSLLDDDAVAASSRGPALKVQVLHHVGDLAAALTEARVLVDRHPQDQALLGAAATLAMDAEDDAFARACAERAPDSPQALAALGMYALEADDTGEASALFARALEAQPGSPRALIGKGLALLAQGDAAGGAEAIAAGAAHFGGHVGSWIAAGWGWLIAGDRAQARIMFERASEIDATFSEAHGGLAVLSFMAGDLAEAERRGEIALRLDRESLGGTLARIMLLEARGDPAAAARIRERALAMPRGPNGKTLLQALAGMNRKIGP